MLLVFDVDGTLISTKAGRLATDRAFERFYGRKGAAVGVPMAGRTDPVIHADICRECGLDPSTFDLWKRFYLEDLVDALVVSPVAILPGVHELLDAVEREAGWVAALGTGNIEEGARLKLEAHNLNRYFATGGFGADGATRDDVIAQGIRKAKAVHGGSFDQILVIGDTPLDIACGKANRCLTVGVATGQHAADELRAAGADLVLADFSNTLEVMAQFSTIRLQNNK